MKTTIALAKRAALIAVLVLGSSAWLNAQTNQGRIGQPAGGLDRQPVNYPGVIDTNSQSSQPLKINKGSAIIGTTVKNQQGEALGKITDLVIDFNSERVSYVVLDSGAGILSAQKLHAIPLRAFQPDTEGKALILNSDKAKLDRSEGFAKDNWPATATATWGAEPSWKDPQGTPKSPEASDADRHTKGYQDKKLKETVEPK